MKGYNSLMKILIVSHLWPRPDWPHVGSFVAEQAFSLSRREEVAAAIPINTSMRRDELSLQQTLSGFPRYNQRCQSPLIQVDNVRVIPLPYKGGIFRQRFPRNTVRNLVDSLDQQIDDTYDIVHAHTIFPDGLACAHWLKGKQSKLLVTAHGSDVYSVTPSVKKVLNPLLNNANMFVPVCQYLGNHFLDWGVDEKRVSVVFNGFKTELYQDLDINQKDPNKIVFLGRVDSVKRVDLIIRALQHCDEKYYLEIAGDGNQRKACEALVQQLGMQHRVRFLGLIDRSKVPKLLASAKLLCLFSTHEGWPTVIFESLAAGTPVLATNAGGTGEAISDPKLGTVIPVDSSAEELCHEMRIALIREWDHDYIRNYAMTFSWDYIADKLLKLYEQVLQKK